MRNVVLLLFGLMLGPALAFGQTGQERWHWEQFFKDGLTHDFGTVPKGTQLFYRLKMKNIYAVPLEVNARVGCTCVTVAPMAQVLQPRQDGYLDVNMDTSRLSGYKSVNIYVTAAGRDSAGQEYISSTTLRVSATSRTDVVVNPGQISFGVVPRGQATAPHTIDVEYAGVLDWRITDLVKFDAPLGVQVKELYRRPGQVGYQVAVVIKPDAPAGPFKHELLLKTNDPASPLVPILIEANIQAKVSVAPSTWHFEPLKVGESATKLVMVRASKPFRIVAIEGQGDGLVVELPTTAATAQILQVKFQATKPGEMRRQLQIKTDLDQESTASVTIQGSVEP